MVPDNTDGGDDRLPEPLLSVLRDPSKGKRRLPYLLGMLEEDDVRKRLSASWAIVLVAVSDEEMFDYAVRRLVDRIDEESPMEIRHTLDYLAAYDAKQVDEVLVELEEEVEVQARQLMYQTGGGFARNQYLLPTEGDRPIGRTRVASGSASDPRRIYTGNRDEEPEWRTDDESDRSDGDESEDSEASEDGGDYELDLSDADPESTLTSGEIARISRRLSAIITDSRFDDLEVLSDRSRERYADVYRTAATVDDEEEAVALCLFRLPEENRQEFVMGLTSALEYWADVHDHETLVTVYDWGWNPWPWATVEYTDQCLDDFDQVSVADAVANVCELAEGIGYAHQHGVVHGAIDPTNVVYYGNVLREDDRQEARLSNVGLTALYRHFFDLTAVINPRYAPPEFFSDRYGSVDPSSDVYALGAVLYRLLTGLDPYTGSLESVREQILAPDPPAPSTVDDSVPDAFDQIVGKAMARHKLKRYETVTNFERELRSIEDTNGG